MTVAKDELLLELLEILKLLELLELLESLLIGVPANIVQAFFHAVSIIVANAAYAMLHPCFEKFLYKFRRIRLNRFFKGVAELVKGIGDKCIANFIR